MDRVLIFLACLVFIFNLLTGLSFCEDLGVKEKQLQEIQRKLEENKRKLQLTRRKEQEVLGHLVVINKNLKKTTRQLTQNKSRLSENEQKLNHLAYAVNKGRQQLLERKNLFIARIKEIYKSGSMNYLELLLVSNTLADFINRSYFFEKILWRDVNLLGEVKQIYENLRKNKDELEDTTKEIRLLTRLIENKKDLMENQAKEKKEIYEQLETRRREYEKKVAELEETSNEIESMIQKTLAEKKKKGGEVVKGSGKFARPLEGRLTSKFGYRRSPFWRGVHMHTGIDIASPYGSPIKAADGGEVIFSGWWNGYGKAVIIDHGNKYSTVYAHMSRIYMQKGEAVVQGQTVGLVGSTGYSTGPHLHFEIRVNGKPDNPLKWL